MRKPWSCPDEYKNKNCDKTNNGLQTAVTFKAKKKVKGKNLDIVLFYYVELANKYIYIPGTVLSNRAPQNTHILHKKALKQNTITNLISKTFKELMQCPRDNPRQRIIFPWKACFWWWTFAFHGKCFSSASLAVTVDPIFFFI